jgi:hypothetical protein
MSNHKPDEEKQDAGGASGGTSPENLPDDEDSIDWGELPQGGQPQALAKQLPRPTATLGSLAFSGPIEDLTVSLIGDPALAPGIENIQGINEQSETECRAPLSSALAAILRKEGGSMRLADLAAEVSELWNRPFPSSFYSKEEFVYLVVKDNDHMRVSE